MFAALPTEILRLIFTHFCLHCHANSNANNHHQSEPTTTVARFRGPKQQHPNESSWHSLDCHALYMLCLVSRRFRDIAQPILYHEFVPGYGDSWRSASYSWEGRLVSFMQTVADRRDLAALVKRIYIHPFLLDSIDDEEAQDALCHAALALGVENFEKQQQNLGPSLVTLLIAALPTLEHCSLQVHSYPRSDEGIHSSTLRAAGISQLPLTTIDIALQSASWMGIFSLDSRAGPFLELSTNLQTLNLHMCGDIWTSPSPPPSCLQTLKKLCLTSSRLNATDLEGLLSSCPCLSVFVYEATHPTVDVFSCCPISDDRDAHFDASSALESLIRHQHTTLKSLHLDLRLWNWLPFTASNTKKVQSQSQSQSISFAGFTVLEHLFLDSSTLYRAFRENPLSVPKSQFLVQLLPPGIASLNLAGNISVKINKLTYFPHFVNGLLSLADAVLRGKFPKLKRVRCDAEEQRSRLHDWYGDGDGDAVAARFAAAGVDFGYDSWPLSDPTLSPQPQPTSFEPMPLPVLTSDDDDL